MICSDDRVAYCDAGPTWDEDHITEGHEEHIYNIPKYDFEPESFSYAGKVYNTELKSLFSAFHPKTFAITALRSFSMYYLPLLEPRAALEDDDEDFLADNSEDRPLDLITPFHKAVRQTLSEVCSICLIFPSNLTFSHWMLIKELFYVRFGNFLPCSPEL